MARSRLCLKARPTVKQLEDRLRPVDGSWPDGLELYLDAADVRDQAAMDSVVRNLERHDLPTGFSLLAEGPVGSLDGAFFDVTRESDADRTVVERLANLAVRLGVGAINIHVIAPGDDLSRLSLECHDLLLRRAVPFLQHFVDVTRASGAVPTVENMPPVLRMRQGGYYFTPIGMASEDLLWLVDQVPGLALLPDTSHAGLYLNARRRAKGGALSGEHEGMPWLEPLMAYLRQLPDEPEDLVSYMRALDPHIANAQVSNARGILGEGLPYREGDFDLDPAIRWLDTRAANLVTETLEPDQDDARHMRDALRCMRTALS